MGFLSNWKVNLSCVKTMVQSKPIFAAWHITYRCNAKCKFCSFWKNEIDISKEMKLADYANAVPKLLNMGIRVVNFAGGEPCIRKDLHEIVKLFSKDFIVIINTNGHFITGAYAKSLWEAGVDIVNVSLDFFDSEKHDFYRGVKAYDSAVEAIKVLQKARTKKGQKVAIQAILSPMNIDEFEKMVQFADDLSVDFAFNPYRFGEHEVDMSFKNADVSFLYELKKKYKSFIATDYALDKTIEFIKNGISGTCGMGRYMIAIDPYGNVGPCENMMELCAGNILSDNPIVLLNNLGQINKENICNKCLTRERSEVEPLYEKIGSPRWIKESLSVKKG